MMQHSVYLLGISRTLFFSVVLLGLWSCASFDDYVAAPDVELVSIEKGQLVGLQQMFDVKVAVKNPNAINLNLDNIDYSLSLEGFDVIEGVLNNIPVIPAYGEKTVGLQVGIGLLEGLKMLNELLNKDQASLDYTLTMKLDTGIPLLGVLPITKTGVVDKNSFNQ